MKPLFIVVAVAVFGLAGCSDYLDRRETVSLGAGNAQEVNKTTHVVNPLPPHAADTSLVFDGQVMGKAASDYRTGKVEEVTAPSSQ